MMRYLTEWENPHKYNKTLIKDSNNEQKSNKPETLNKR